MDAVLNFLKEKPLSITAFAMAAMNLAAAGDIEPFTDPEFVEKANIALAAFLGLFVTKTVTANKKITGHLVGPYNGVK